MKKVYADVTEELAETFRVLVLQKDDPIARKILDDIKTAKNKKPLLYG